MILAHKLHIEAVTSVLEKLVAETLEVKVRIAYVMDLDLEVQKQMALANATQLLQ